MHKKYIPTLLLQLLLLLLEINPATSQTSDDPTGFGTCNMCILLDNPEELAPCSGAWRNLMNVCSTNDCAKFASFVDRAPPASSCTNTPPPLPGGTAPAGFSSISWDTTARESGSGTATGSAGRSIITGNATAAATNRTTTPRVTNSPTGGTGGDSGSGSNSGSADQTAGAVRTIIAGFGMGWLWEVVFLFWGVIW